MLDSDHIDYAGRYERGNCILCDQRPALYGIMRCGPCSVRSFLFRELHHAKRHREVVKIERLERKLGL